MTTDSKYKRAATNSTYKKLAVQRLNEALCFVSSFVVVDRFVLRNRQLLVAANPYINLIESLSLKVPQGSAVQTHCVLQTKIQGICNKRMPYGYLFKSRQLLCQIRDII